MIKKSCQVPQNQENQQQRGPAAADRTRSKAPRTALAPQTAAAASVAGSDAPILAPDFKASIQSSFEKFEQFKARSRTNSTASVGPVGGLAATMKEEVSASIATFNEMLKKAPSRPLPWNYQYRHSHKLYPSYVGLQEQQQQQQQQQQRQQFTGQDKSWQQQRPDGLNTLQPNVVARDAAGLPVELPVRKSMSYELLGNDSTPQLKSGVTAGRRNSQLQFLTTTLAALRHSSAMPAQPPTSSIPAAAPMQSTTRLTNILEIPPFRGNVQGSSSIISSGGPGPAISLPSRDMTKKGVPPGRSDQTLAKRERSPAPKERGSSPADENRRLNPKNKQVSAVKSTLGRSASDNALFPLRTSPLELNDMRRPASPTSKGRNIPTTPKTSIKRDGKRYTAEDAKRLPLKYPWTLYYDNRAKGGPKHVLGKKENYESNLQTIYCFQDVFAFCGVMNNVKRPSQLEVNSNLHLFKNGIKPMWEDPVNTQGGKWTFTFGSKHHSSRPEVCDRMWLNLAMAVVGDQFGEDVCGIVVSRRNRGDRISVWMPNALSRQKVEQLREEIVEFADVGSENLPLDFAAHEASLSGTPK